ncbi:MAG TPA: RNA-binding protein [Polyangiaceae bacterium]|nr:RNA-binding protein [Polyangiaceae bacterium]
MSVSVERSFKGRLDAVRKRETRRISMRLFVGNLAYSTTEDRLRQEFQRFGNVTSVAVVIDRMSGRSRGFGFVEFATNEEGQSAMNELNGTELDGREIVVNEARARGTGGPGGGGGGGPRPRRGGGHGGRRDGGGFGGDGGDFDGDFGGNGFGRGRRGRR